MNTRGQRIHPLIAGAVAFVVVAFVIGVMGWINLNFSAPPPISQAHTLTVETTDADGISPSSDVRIAGRLVGQVVGVRANGAKAEVTIKVDASEWPLPADTTASVRLATLLGQKYIELEPPVKSTAAQNGAASNSNLQDGGTITKAAPVVDFDQILDTFDKPTRDHIVSLIGTGADAVANQEGNLQNLLPDWRTLSEHSTVPTGEMSARDPELNGILQHLAVTADQLNRSRDDFAAVITQANKLNGAFAQNTDALRGFIRNGDILNRTTDTVLGGGYARKLGTDLVKVDTIVRDLNATFTTVYPMSSLFQRTAQKATIDLAYEIGDATSQSDRDGHFIRQTLQGLDFAGLLPGQNPLGQGGSGPPPPPSQSQPALPQLPGLPQPPPVPGLPTLPPVPGGGASPAPTAPPPPSPGCVVLCGHLDTPAGGSGADATLTMVELMGAG